MNATLTERLSTLMGGEKQLDLARKAALKIRCLAEHGNHLWAVIGGEKGNILILRCQRCEATKKESM